MGCSVKVGDRMNQGSGRHNYGIAEVLEIKRDIVNCNNHTYSVYLLKVRFDNTGKERWCTSGGFLRGEVKDFFAPVVFGKGYLGEIGYNKNIQVNKLLDYSHWKKMLQRTTEVGRCSSSTADVSRYEDVICSDDFYNFSKFHEFWEKQSNLEDLLYYFNNVDKKIGINLDKDILVRGNRIYSSETCCIVPTCINMAVVTRKSNENSNYPCCVYLHQSGVIVKMSISYCCDERNIDSYLRNNCSGKSFIKSFNFDKCNRSIHRDYYVALALDFYNSNSLYYNECELAAIGMALEAYKFMKEAYVRSVARDLYNKEYNGRVYHLITKECYEALMNWDIRIEDC